MEKNNTAATYIEVNEIDYRERDEDELMYNRGLIGTTFTLPDGERATYIKERYVGQGFINICRCIPHSATDHAMYARRRGGGWVCVGQPYEMGDEAWIDVRGYCGYIGLTMDFQGVSTHNPHRCHRIIFCKGTHSNDRWNIAINSSRWRSDYDPHYTDAMFRGVEKRVSRRRNGF